ncbi:MAG: DUF1566 domain-containing protein [Deltaproteobacteria bacterium]
MIDNGNGTVTDETTGLMWQQVTPEKVMIWDQATAYCRELQLSGYADWRLPTIHELNKIVDYNRFEPAIDNRYFINTAASWYWSSNTYVNFTSRAWGVYFGNGSVNYGSKNHAGYVRAVRGTAWNQSAKAARIHDLLAKWKNRVWRL